MNISDATWVVYLMPLHHKEPVKAVCSRSEWDAMALQRPGYYSLFREGLPSEGAAEAAARGEPKIVPQMWPKRRS